MGLLVLQLDRSMRILWNLEVEQGTRPHNVSVCPDLEYTRSRYAVLRPASCYAVLRRASR
jgi:hypothetical protein